MQHEHAIGTIQSTSGNSDDTSTMAIPSAASAIDLRVDLLLRRRLSIAARRLVEKKHFFGSVSSQLREHDLLLIAAGEACRQP